MLYAARASHRCVRRLPSSVAESFPAWDIVVLSTSPPISFWPQKLAQSHLKASRTYKLAQSKVYLYLRIPPLGHVIDSYLMVHSSRYYTADMIRNMCDLQ